MALVDGGIKLLVMEHIYGWLKLGLFTHIFISAIISGKKEFSVRILPGFENHNIFPQGFVCLFELRKNEKANKYCEGFEPWTMFLVCISNFFLSLYSLVQWMHNRDNLESGSGVSNPKWSPIQISSHLLPTTTPEYHQSITARK